MNATPREHEVARRYLYGECNELQLNYLVHTENLDRARIEGLIDQTCYRMPLATAAKFLLTCVLAHFLVCLAYAIIQS